MLVVVKFTRYVTSLNKFKALCLIPAPKIWKDIQGAGRLDRNRRATEGLHDCVKVEG